MQNPFSSCNIETTTSKSCNNDMQKNSVAALWGHAAPQISCHRPEACRHCPCAPLLASCNIQVPCETSHKSSHGWEQMPKSWVVLWRALSSISFTCVGWPNEGGSTYLFHLHAQGTRQGRHASCRCWRRPLDGPRSPLRLARRQPFCRQALRTTLHSQLRRFATSTTVPLLQISPLPLADHK